MAHAPRSARLLVVAALLTFAGVACKKKSAPTAEPPPVGVEFASCGNSSGPCNAGLECAPHTRRCVKPDHPELVEARQAALDTERNYLEQSGVQPPTHAEQPAAPSPDPSRPAAAGAVRVVTIKTGGKGSHVFAACRADERLVSGGCKLNNDNITSVIDSYPSHHDAGDTVGARWNCGQPGSDLDLEAYALCQRL